MAIKNHLLFLLFNTKRYKIRGGKINLTHNLGGGKEEEEGEGR